uniref:WD repeat-containing protein 93 isoform X3 n=1 Tax=Doryrhamphus excisus TaxID=161450 RepID=UPI0025ADA5E3|nr:WD repeat-containing protein 93 isoform X3 [Doryrhamphus excisus]
MTSVCSSAGKLRKKSAVLQLTSAAQLPAHTNCLSCSDDDKYLTIGHARGLSVWCSSTLTCEATWQQDKLEITSVHMVTTCETSYLLASIDDMGVARVFLYNLESIYLFSVINTLDDINKRSICLNFDISEGGNYGAITMNCNSDIWLDIYLFPVEDWLRELKDPKISANMKWSPAARVNKIIPTAANMADSSDLLTHCLILDETNEPPRHCTYHFLMKCGPCHGENKPTPAGCPVIVCFWWNGSYNLLYHTLSKTPKSKQDPEPQPSVLWPNAAEILCSAVSRCTRFIVLGLSNTLVCVWDRLVGDKEPTGCSSSLKHKRQRQLLVLRFDEHDVIEPYVVSHLQFPWQQKTSVTGEDACNMYLQKRALSLDERHKALTETWKRLQATTGADVKT